MIRTDNSYIILLFNQQKKIYAKEIYSWFCEYDTSFVVFPDFLTSSLLKTTIPQIKIADIDQYKDFLESELKFWKQICFKNRLKTWNVLQNLKVAKFYFVKCILSLNKKEIDLAKKHLFQSFSMINGKVLYSKTELAKLLFDFKYKSNAFVEGFRKIIDNSFNNIAINEFEGAVVACIYTNQIPLLPLTPPLDAFNEKLQTLSQNYEALNALYSKSFLDQEKRLGEISYSNDQHLKSLTEKSETFWNENVSRRDELEKVYREKLRLEAPAEHWDAMAKKYNSKGTKWLWISVAVAVAVIAILLSCFFYMSMAKTENISWFGVVRNYVILTATVGIGVYMLRLFVRMCMSCYHQARDAEERSKLASFYLSLFEKGVVSDKERALVINSLFSRADTGLLKRDSGPVMSQNVTELVEAFTKK